MNTYNPNAEREVDRGRERERERERESMSTSPEPIGNNIDNPDNPDNPNNLNNPNISNYPNNPNYPNACPIGDNNPSQDEEEEEKEENFASALGDGYFPIPEAKGVCRGERLGEGARVYASAKRFATEKEVKQILQKVDAELVSTRMAVMKRATPKLCTKYQISPTYVKILSTE